jgi:hypothetical protein
MLRDLMSTPYLCQDSGSLCVRHLPHARCALDVCWDGKNDHHYRDIMILEEKHCICRKIWGTNRVEPHYTLGLCTACYSPQTFLANNESRTA